MYNDYFGFSVSPFSITPDPRFFYTTPVYREAFANLQYGIEAKKGFIVVTGEVGTGKTTLLRRLMTHNFRGTIHTAFLFNTNLNFAELLLMIVSDFGLTATEPNNKAMLLQELNKFLLTQLTQGHIVAVLVDEAQNLSDEALEGLRLLSNMETDQEKLIQIVLIGQPELEATLDRPTLRQLKQRVALRCRISPLEDKEVEPYIDFRLSAAGYKGRDLFDSDALTLLAFYSNGIPRLVNIICDNALLSAFAANQKTVCGDIIEEVARDLRLGNEVQRNPASTASRGGPIDKSNPVIVEGQLKKLIDDSGIKQVVPTPKLEEMIADVFQLGPLEAEREPETRAGKPSVTSSQPPPRRALKVAFATAMMFVAVIALVWLMEPKDFVRTAGKTLDHAKHNMHQWVFLVTNQEAPLQETTASEEVRFEPKEQRITIPHGSSVYQVAGYTYGLNSNLGVDLIREFNPGIKNLSRVWAGQPLVLPTLALETLLRKQFDGSYHLIVGSFRRQITAEEYATRLKAKGYTVTITPRRIADGLLLHRVEIIGLKTFEEANQTWFTALGNEWLVLPDNKQSELAKRNKVETQ